MKTIINRLLVIIIGLSFAHALEAQSYKIIVNTSNGTTSLSKSEIADLFMKKKTKWDNGNAVLPIDLGANSKVRETFSQEIHGKSVTAVRSYWQQAVFSGSASVPPEKTSDAEIIDFVKKNPGAIGYISGATSADGVKVVGVN